MAAATAFAPPDVKDVTLALFAGRKSDVAPSDLPEGLTPDEQDGIYVPGEWASRPGLARLYAAGQLTPGTSVLYEKTYVQPNDDPLTLVLTSDGKLWVEDVGANPGALSNLFTVPAGLYAQSVTTDGREYIAFSDLLHGQGVPLQYDGTNLDRVTQDGPGAGPTVANVAPATAALSSSGAGTAYAITSVTPSDPMTATIKVLINGRWTTETITYYSTLTVVAAVNPLTAGEIVSLTGITPASFDANNVTVVSVSSTTTFKVPFYGMTSSGGTGGHATVQNPTLVRSNGIVTAHTTAAHGFQPGWQVQISGINNTDIGGGIASISRDGFGVVTVTTTTAHGLVEGATIAIVGVTDPDTSFDAASVKVSSVISPTVFTYQQGGTAEVSGSGTGNVQDVWNVTAFIQSTPTASTFTYEDTGPNDISNDSGTATIIGQISPGTHGIVVIFVTRNGALTQPSPPIQFQANGGQQALLTEIPTGPANVVARLIGATGAGGDNYFTEPSTPQVAGQITGTSLLIPDNTSTSALIDFNDNTLFAGIPIDQVGNDLFDQVVIGPVLGFFAFASRLACWGDYNKVENFLNMGFCGGPTGATPLGWTVVTAGGAVVAGGPWAAGQVWQIHGDGTTNPKGAISQSAYQDIFGDPIISPSTNYSVRLWGLPTVVGMAGSVIVELTSVSLGTTIFAQFAIADLPAGGGFFPLTPMTGSTPPSVIPSDYTLTVYEYDVPNGYIIALGEVEIVPTENPYRDDLSRWSYVDNPEGFAETTGELGADDDASPIRCFALLRQSSLLETGEGVHLFEDNDLEPNQWKVNQVTRAVGAVSLRAGDPGKFGTGDAAEDWALVAGKNGVYLFAGAEFWKVSQEISRGVLPQAQDPRKCWDDINWAAQQTIVAKNDPATRRAYFAVPINGATTPNVVFVLDYREMDTSSQIAGAPPLHITIQGKMKSSDLTRKWSVWNISANDLEILIRPGNQRELCFAGGVNAENQAFGNVYSLDPTKLTDDDYGAIGGTTGPYYTTYAFTDHDQEQALGLGADMKLVKRVHCFVAGVGIVIITPIVNSLYNFMPQLSARQLVSDTDQSNFLKSDLEWTIAGLRGQRIFFRIGVRPLPGSTDVQIRLQKFIVGMMQDPVVRFRQSGV